MISCWMSGARRRNQREIAHKLDEWDQGMDQGFVESFESRVTR